MNASELRFGNKIIACRSQKQHDVIRIGFMTINNNAEFRYDGIHLTQEWLYKFGFNEDNFHELGKYLNIQLDQDGDIYNAFIRQENKDDTVDCILLEEVNYVHQLQNLFFALTGRELEIAK